MTERPIIFSASMVQAILAGTKSQTRRVIKHPEYTGCLTGDCPHEKQAECDVALTARSPYGQPGDRLWVRETGWEPKEPSARELRDGADTWPAYAYDADGLTAADADDFRAWGWRRRPSIHMPRWASRILLEVTAVRVERVQDITAADCRAEGVRIPVEPVSNTKVRPLVTLSGPLMPDEVIGKHPREWAEDDYWRFEYALLWESLHRRDGFGWDANPWVWVVSFRRVEPTPKARS